MKVRVFEKNTNGKIEFTRKELEALLNEVYNEGYNDSESKHWTVTYGNTTPITTPITTLNSIPTYTTCTTTYASTDDCVCVNYAGEIEGQLSFAETNPDVFNWSSINV